MDKAKPAPLGPDESVNSGFSAIPKPDPEAEENAFDYGPASEADARASGYTDKHGQAIERARPDVPGSPTGAYTDIGAGRSSVTRPEVRSRT
jgi:hypothetical protein